MAKATKASPAKKKAAPVKKTVKKTTAKKADKKDKPKRAPSAYNIFMKKELEKLKKSDPSLDAKGRFTKAAANWSKSKPAGTAAKKPAAKKPAAKKTTAKKSPAKKPAKKTAKKSPAKKKTTTKK